MAVQKFIFVIAALLIFAAEFGLAADARADRSGAKEPYPIVENHTADTIDSTLVDLLFFEVAEILEISVNKEFPPPRVIIISFEDLQEIYQKSKALKPGFRAFGLYLPKNNYAILITSFDRLTLGHEFAHYFTHLYLKEPREKWEGIAEKVERELTSRPWSKRR